MSTFIITTPKPILVVKSGEEGAFNLFPLGNGNTGGFDPNTLPQWALDEQIASADLAELKDWLVARIGPESYDEMTASGELSKIEFDAIKWVALTDNEEIVDRAPSLDVRAEWLADLVGLEDRSVEAFDAMKADAEALHKSYAETPTDERSLAEAEGKTFEEAIKEQARQYR